jgi:hypothetical protein
MLELTNEMATIRETMVNTEKFTPLLRRIKSMESSLTEIKEGGVGDPDVSKKLRHATREKDSLLEEKEELLQRLRQSEKSATKFQAELARKDEQLAQITAEHKQALAKKEEQHKRRSAAAEEAWRKRREGTRLQVTEQPNHVDPIEDFEEPVASSSSSAPSAPSAASAPLARPPLKVQVPVMNVGQGPGVEYGPGLQRPVTWGLAPDGKATIKTAVKRPMTYDTSDGSSEEFSEDEDETKKAWSKKSNSKKVKKDLDSE